MSALTLKMLNLIALLCAVAWFSRAPDWEPLITALGLLAAFIAQEIKSFKNQRPSPDNQLFQEFLEVLPSGGGSIEFISHFNMAGFAFDSKNLNDLRKFSYEWDNAEHEFADLDLEHLRKRLLAKIDEYLNYFALNTWPTSTGFQTVPPEWEIEQPQRFRETVSKLHDLAGTIVELHQDLVRLGRKRLRI